MQENFINKIIHQYEEKSKDKPRFEMGSLYCGEIVLLAGKTHTKESETPNFTFLPVKKFAIFTTLTGQSFTHVKSHQKMHFPESTSINNYTIKNLKPFKEFFKKRISEMGYDASTKISFNDIVAIEEFENNLLAPNQQQTELFK